MRTTALCQSPVLLAVMRLLKCVASRGFSSGQSASGVSLKDAVPNRTKHGATRGQDSKDML